MVERGSSGEKDASMGGFLSRCDGGNRGNPFKILIFPEISLAFFQNDILLKETKTEYRSEINQIQRRIMLDKTDKAILRLLQQNARMPNAEIARKIKLAPSAVLKLDSADGAGKNHHRI